jgi:hypothetical protein
MTTALVLLLLVALAVWISAARPSLLPTLPQDRDRERQLGELRAMACSRADVHL